MCEGIDKCDKCRMREWRRNNPELDAYRNLQGSARKRKLLFTITFENFLELIEGTGYMEKKGNGPENLTIDRKDNLKGYEKGNLIVMTKAHNVTKYHYLDRKRINKMKKSQLKTGMLIELRSGGKAIVMRGTSRGDIFTKPHGCSSEESTWGELSCITPTLKFKKIPNGDIMRVWSMPDENNNASSGQISGRKLLFEREEKK